MLESVSRGENREIEGKEEQMIKYRCWNKIGNIIEVVDLEIRPLYQSVLSLRGYNTN